MIVAHEIETLDRMLADMEIRLCELEHEMHDRTTGLPAVTEDDLMRLIKQQIAEQGITQTKLCEIVGCSKSTMSMALKGRRRLPLAVVLACLQVIGWKLVCTIEDLPFTPAGDEEDGSEPDVH